MSFVGNMSTLYIFATADISNSASVFATFQYAAKFN